MILRYSVRSIIAQRMASGIAIGVLASTTAIVAVLFGLTEGMVASATEAGDPLVAIVVNEETAETDSSVSNEALGRLSALASSIGGERAVVSPEIVARAQLGGDPSQMTDIVVRGVEPIALSTHVQVKIRGRLPTSGEQACVLGSRQIGRRPSLAAGGKVKLGHQWFPIVGILDAPDTPFESELWCGRTVVRQLMRRDTDSTVYVRVGDASQQAELARGVAAMKGFGLRAMSERAYYRERLKDVALYFRAIYTILGILVVSMIFTGANTIYTSFLGRVRELATLMAIGFTSRRLMLMMTVESLLLTGIGSGIGLLLALSAAGHHYAIEEVGLVFVVKMNALVLGGGVAIAIATGLLSSLVANVQIARIAVLRALRE